MKKLISIMSNKDDTNEQKERLKKLIQEKKIDPSPIMSKAIIGDDEETVRELIEWGFDPNVYLHITEKNGQYKYTGNFGYPVWLDDGYTAYMLAIQMEKFYLAFYLAPMSNLEQKSLLGILHTGLSKYNKLKNKQEEIEKIILMENKNKLKPLEKELQANFQKKREDLNKQSGKLLNEYLTEKSRVDKLKGKIKKVAELQMQIDKIKKDIALINKKNKN